MKRARLFTTVASLGLLLALLGVASPPAGADGNNNGNVFSGTDATNDAEFSTLCQYDDRDPDPYTGIGGTGVQAVNCDNKIGEMDFTSWSLTYVPASSPEALLDPAGNDHIWGTSDDSRGPDGKSATGDEPAITGRMGTLKASWTFAKPWPASNMASTFKATGSRNDENMSGLSAFIAYRNADIQKNDLQALCDRSATTTSGGPAYVFDPRGVYHYEDGTYFHIWVSWEFKGATTGTGAWQQSWQPKMNFGYYDPNIDQDIHLSSTPQNNPLYNPQNTGVLGTNPWTGLGKFYDWNLSSDRKTVTVKFPAVYTEIDQNCLDQGSGPNQEPYRFTPYARTAADKTGSLAPRSARTGTVLNPGNGQDDRLFDVFAQSLVSVRPNLPVPIPTGSLVCANLCPIVDALPRTAVPVVGNVPPQYPITRQDLDWIIGLGFTADVSQLSDGSDGFQGGVLGTSPSLGPSAWPGPTCNTPTQGGNLPNNPLWNRGNPCAVRNPVSVGLKHSNNHLHVF